MFLAFILLIIVAFCGAQFAPTGRLHTDYCSKATTTAVNGIFVVMVFFRHLIPTCRYLLPIRCKSNGLPSTAF